MLARVPLSLYAGKKTLSPAGFAAGDADIRKAPKTIARKVSTGAALGGSTRGDQPPWRDRRFEKHRARKLRFALPALDKCDRHFADTAAALRGHVQHLDQKRIAVRDEAIERQPGERLAAPAAVAARAIASAQSRHRPDVGIGEAAERTPPQRPVEDSPSRSVPRSDDHLGAIGGGDQIGQARRIVGEVGIHLTDDVDRLANRLPEAIDVRPSEAPALRP